MNHFLPLHQMIPRLKVIRFNKLVPYHESLKLQEQLVASKLADRQKDFDYLLILQHEPCITIGKRSHVQAERLRSSVLDYPIIESPRGGRATFHGPGQITCYSIVDLKHQQSLSLECYVRNLAAVMSDFLSSTFNIKDSVYNNNPDRVGLWLPGNKKIGFIGIQAQKWIASHGFSLNISAESLDGFKFIDPCGLAAQNVKITCAEQEAKTTSPKIDEMELAMLHSFQKIFGYK